jgi:hypothetical protein
VSLPGPEPAAGRPRRPFGVTLLAVLFLLGAVSLLGSAAQLAATQPENAAKPAGALYLVCGLVLPAVWLSAAGGGLLAGRAWARMLVVAMAVLAVVIAAGALPGIGRSPSESMRAGAALAVLAVTAGGAWYLSTDRVKAWLR